MLVATIFPVLTRIVHFIGTQLVLKLFTQHRLNVLELRLTHRARVAKISKLRQQFVGGGPIVLLPSSETEHKVDSHDDQGDQHRRPNDGLCGRGHQEFRHGQRFWLRLVRRSWGIQMSRYCPIMRVDRFQVQIRRPILLPLCSEKSFFGICVPQSAIRSVSS